MIRVLHVLPDLQVGGGQGVVLQLIRNRDAQRFDIHVAYLREPSEFASAFRSAGVEPMLLDGGRARTEPSPLLRLRHLVRMIRGRRIDLVHVHSDVDRKYGHAASLLTGVPVVGHLHSPCDHHGPRYPEQPSVARKVLGDVKGWGRDALERHAVRHYVAAGDEVARFHRNLCHAPVATVPNGIPTEQFATAGSRRDQVREQLGLAPQDVVLVCVGRLAVDKGQDEIIAMLPGLPGHLLLVGEGELRSQLEEVARKQGVLDRVRFLGNRSDVADILGASDVFVFGSVVEGLPLAVLEAMAAGLPVVAYRLPGLVGVVDHGRSGYLIDPGDRAAFQARVHDIVGRDGLARDLGAVSLRIATERFDAKGMTRSVETVYQQVIAATSA